MAPSSERSVFDNADHDVKLLMMYTRACFYAKEPGNAAAYSPVEACGAHEWSCIVHGWRAFAATQPPTQHIDKNKSWAAWAEEEEEAAEPTKTLADAKSEVAGEVPGMRLRGGGLPRHASAHGQEDDCGGTLILQPSEQPAAAKTAALPTIEVRTASLEGLDLN